MCSVLQLQRQCGGGGQPDLLKLWKFLSELVVLIRFTQPATMNGGRLVEWLTTQTEPNSTFCKPGISDG